MAKGKHAAALFEVINKGKKHQTSRGSILRTPSWWFKNRPPAETPPPPTAQSAPAPQAALPTQTPQPQPVQSASVENPAPDAPPQEHDPTAGVRLVGPNAAREFDPATATPPPAQSSPALAVDPGQKQIALRLSYATAGIGAFVLLIVVSIAYLVGRQVNTGPAPAIAARSTEQVQQDDPQPQVLDVSRGAPVSSIPPAQQGQPRPQPAPVQQNQAAQTPTAPQTPTPYVEDDGPRTIGLNYVIIQSYRDEEMAQRYARLLIQDGIRCTVEQDLPNWSQGGPWYSIVGTRGFARIRNSDFEDYIQSIRRANDRHGLTGFRRFDPQPYHWKGTR